MPMNFVLLEDNCTHLDQYYFVDLNDLYSHSVHLEVHLFEDC